MGLNAGTLAWIGAKGAVKPGVPRNDAEASLPQFNYVLLGTADRLQGAPIGVSQRRLGLVGLLLKCIGQPFLGDWMGAQEIAQVAFLKALILPHASEEPGEALCGDFRFSQDPKSMVVGLAFGVT